MKNERPWSWRIIKNDSLKKKVTAIIESIDNKSQLQLENIDPQLVDTITSFLTSSYRWGATEESNVDAIIDENRDKLQPSDDEINVMVQDAVKPLLEEIAELKDQKTKDAQSIGGLKGQLTRLKAKLEADSQES